MAMKCNTERSVVKSFFIVVIVIRTLLAYTFYYIDGITLKNLPPLWGRLKIKDERLKIKNEILKTYDSTKIMP
jgi:hypothetical protein